MAQQVVGCEVCVDVCSKPRIECIEREIKKSRILQGCEGRRKMKVWFTTLRKDVGVDRQVVTGQKNNKSGLLRLAGPDEKKAGG